MHRGRQSLMVHMGARGDGNVPSVTAGDCGDDYSDEIRRLNKVSIYLSIYLSVNQLCSIDLLKSLLDCDCIVAVVNILAFIALEEV